MIARPTIARQLLGFSKKICNDCPKAMQFCFQNCRELNKRPYGVFVEVFVKRYFFDTLSSPIGGACAARSPLQSPHSLPSGEVPPKAAERVLTRSIPASVIFSVLPVYQDWLELPILICRSVGRRPQTDFAIQQVEQE